MYGEVGKNVFSCIFICIGIIDVIAVYGFSIKNEYVPAINIIRNKRQSVETCSEGFKCKTSGECLPIDMRCDGIVNCRDESDEFDDCKTAVLCPGLTYVCGYGACVDGDSKCDGKKDCRDNSDEANCPNVSNLIKSKDQISNCTSDQFQCLSGQCISEADKCDGVPNCQDQSDETKDTCLNMNCPGWTFKCDYGACVDGDSKCDGRPQCFDNSDEEGCEPAKPTEPAKPKKPSTEPTKPPHVEETPGGCLLPSHPENGKWVVQGNNVGWEPGKSVATSTILKFSCESGHKMSGVVHNFCTAEGWLGIPPKCLDLCPPLNSTNTTKVTCYNSDQSDRHNISCSEATDGATAEYECSPFYEPSEKVVQTRYCVDKYWNLPVPRCIPVCGQKTVSATPLIIGGKIVPIRGDYPWVAAVFHKNDDGVIKNACGGSMLSQRVILTAAHCVSNSYGNTISTDLVKVAVGKYYNSFGDVRDNYQAQYSGVKTIDVHSRFKGDFRRYGSDIAFLITTEVLLLSQVVQPVCYSNLNRIHLRNGDEGIVTGWGYTTSTSEPSDALKEILVPYKDDNTCFQELPSDWADRYFDLDKICAGHHNQSSGVCKGDSGGGLVFRNPSDNRFYVHGIVSITKTITGRGGCDVNYSALYTKVATYYDWLVRVVSRYSS